VELDEGERLPAWRDFAATIVMLPARRSRSRVACSGRWLERVARVPAQAIG
jgi:hypothetical protein